MKFRVSKYIAWIVSLPLFLLIVASVLGDNPITDPLQLRKRIVALAELPEEKFLPEALTFFQDMGLDIPLIKGDSISVAKNRMIMFRRGRILLDDGSKHDNVLVEGAVATITEKGNWTFGKVEADDAELEIVVTASRDFVFVNNLKSGRVMRITRPLR